MEIVSNQNENYDENAADIIVDAAQLYWWNKFKDILGTTHPFSITCTRSD